MQTEKSMSRKIVITSGKGGVGKTSVCANLGIRLASLGKRVCMVDADFGLNNLDLVTGLENLVVYDAIDCIEGRCRPKQALIRSKANKNAYILPSIHSLSKPEFPPEKLKDLIEGLSTSFDFVLIDCPAGVSGGFKTAVSVADEALLITTPHLSSLRDADKVIAFLRSFKTQTIKLVINRVRGDLVVGGMTISPEEIEKTLKCRLAGVIPEDDRIFLYSAGFLPPDSPSYKAFKILASNVANDKDRIFNYSKEYRGFLGSIRRGLKRTL